MRSLTFFDVSRLLLLPRRKVYGLIVETPLNPAILKEVIDLLIKHKSIIPLGYHYLSPDRSSIIVLMFVDLTETKISIEDLARELSKIEGVRSVKSIYPTVEGFVADTHSTYPLVLDDRALILRKPLYEGLIVGMRKQFGSVGEASLYYIGYEAGIKLGESHLRIAESLGVEDPIEILGKIVKPIAQCMGFGIIEIVEARLKPPLVTMRIHKNPECELGLGSGRPYSHFIRGICTGILTRLYRVEMETEEVLCIAKGDPYCEFKVAPRGKA